MPPSPKQAIYQELLRCSLAQLRSVAEASPWRRLRDRSARHEAALVREIPALLTEPGFGALDLWFLNGPARAYHQQCSATLSEPYPAQLRLLRVLFALMPEALRGALQWPGPGAVDPRPEVTPEAHSRGAIVQHLSPYANLDIAHTEVALPEAFLARWVRPHYGNLIHHEGKDTGLADLAPAMTEAVATALLREYNWRPRIVGARLVALRRMHGLTDLVGRLLLRSDVCYAGRGYAVALARLDTPTARLYLEHYLDYYLARPDLWFDQDAVMGAIAWLDQRHGTQVLERFRAPWAAFIANKQNWDLEHSIADFAREMEKLERTAT